jgi:hypothetical protein
MAEESDRTPHIRITRSSITVQDSPSDAPRTFARHIECSGSNERERQQDSNGSRGEHMRYREGEDRGRRRQS